MAIAKTYVVSGANRGLGLEMVKQLLKRDGVKVVAGARNPASADVLNDLAKQHPDRLKILKLDIDDEQSIKDAATQTAEAFPSGLSVLVNNAGIAGDNTKAAALDTTTEDMLRVFKTNAVGSFLVSKHFLPLFKKGNPDNAIVNISSSAGCIGEKSKAVQAGTNNNPFAGRGMGYSMSKAALNMETVVMAQALKPAGVAVVSLHPGWVQTDMGIEGGRGTGLDLTPDMTTPESVEAQLKVIDGLTQADSGKFFNVDGSIHPW
jgi:NAD(P)-dependent dehydrogenase (short-subunit alcohol dehydrogenase family)